jgi:heptosyltransferase-2
VDSVAGHVAAAVGTPCVIAYSGITDPVLWGPRGSAATVVRHPVPCAPCYRARGCEAMDCVRNIIVEQMHAAIDDALTARGACEVFRATA